MDQDYKALTIAAYPFVILGSFVALICCLYAVAKTRREDTPMWWLFVGICCNMFALFVENLWFGWARFIDDWEKLNNVHFFISGMKILHATGAWLHSFGALAIIFGFTKGFVRRALLYGTCIFIPAYLWLIYLLT